MKLGKWELGRRDLLKRLGLGAAMLPVLRETLEAQTAVKGRLIVLVKGNGVRAETFWPTWAGARPADGTLATATLPHVTAPLLPWKDKLQFLDGLTLRNWLRSEGNTTGDNGDAHHNWGSLLTGELPSDRLLTDGRCRLREQPAGCRMLAGAPSLDCFVGKQARTKEPSLAFDSLHAALNVDDLPTARKTNGFACPSWFDRDQPNPPEPDPKVFFQKVFGGSRMLPGAGASTPDPRQKDHVRLLSFVGRDLERFSRRLGTEDRQRVQEHLTAVRRREEQLATLMDRKLACARPPEPGTSYIVKKEAHVPAQSRLMMDMIIDAMKCGLTRAACYSLYDSNAYHAFFSWLDTSNPNFANQGGPKISEFPNAHFHAMAHGNGKEPGTTMYADANRWLMQQYAYVLERLAKEPEGTGTMLDNTLVLWVDSLSNGGGHHVTRLPWILAGNVGNRFKTGRHVAFAPGTAPNGLFLAIAEAMGVAPPGGVIGNAKFGRVAYQALM